MGSVSISTLILFIAAMIIAAAVAGTLVANVSDISSSIDTYSGEVRNQIDTDIDVISDPGSQAVYNDTPGEERITLLIKNTGDRTIDNDTRELDVLVNGEFIPREDLSIEVLDGDVWRSGVVAKLEIEYVLDPGEHRIVVDVTGDREVFQYYVS